MQPWLALITIVIVTTICLLVRFNYNSNAWRFHVPPRRRVRSIADLAAYLDEDLKRMQTFKPSYRRAEIPKKRGGRRVLHIPDDETRHFQQLIVRRILSRPQAHSAACAYEQGKSIVDNAQPHTGSQLVIRMDVVDFFTTTSARRIEHFFRMLGWDRAASRWLARACTLNRGLPQGACTSPRLSNLVNVELDRRLAGAAKAANARYTRYADDITFSFDRSHHDDANLARKASILQRRSERIARSLGYQMHQHRKRFVRRRHQQQQVTGLVVNERVALPRKTRRWLRAVEHRLKTGRHATLTPEQLAGWQALRDMIQRTALNAQSTTNHADSTDSLQQNRFLDAIRLIRSVPLGHNDRDTFIAGLTGVHIQGKGNANENFPTLIQGLKGTPYQHGRTLVLQLDESGLTAQLRVPAHQAAQSLTLGSLEQVAFQATVVGWSTTYDCPILQGEITPP